MDWRWCADVVLGGHSRPFPIRELRIDAYRFFGRPRLDVCLVGVGEVSQHDACLGIHGPVHEHGQAEVHPQRDEDPPPREGGALVQLSEGREGVREVMEGKGREGRRDV